MYGRIDMNTMSKFKSGYGLALYENCIRFQGLSNTPWLSLEVFRKLMGIADESYPVFCDFKKRVLDIALREVNQYSHLQVSPEIKRVSKKVTNIRFKLAAKQSKMIYVEHSVLDGKADLTKILMNEFELSAELTQDVLSKYGYDYTHDKICFIKNSESFKSGKIRALAPYFIDALKRDYKKSKSSKTLITESQNARFDKEQQEKKIQEEQQKRYGKYVSNQVEQCLSNLSEAETLVFSKEFECEISSNTMLFKWYKKHGLKHAAVKATFNIFVKNRLGEELKILGIDAFLNGTSDVCGIT